MRIKYSFLMLFVILSISCSRELLKTNEIEPWLKSKSTEYASIIISGTWRDDKDKPAFIISGDRDGIYAGAFDLGWGKGVFVQKGNAISGSLGQYSIKGVVSGENIFLIMSYGSRIDFVAHLFPAGDKLVGNYFYEKEMKAGYPMILAGGEIYRK